MMPMSTAGLERGASLGRYLVLDRLGQGGMGVVYTAYDPELDRRLAVKLLRPDAGAAQAETRRTRLQREAQAMARLSHPNVIAVHDVGTAGDQVFVAMELVDGVTLKRWLAAERRPWRDVLALFVQAGRGLAAAHDAGLIHRDFKPDNVLVGKNGVARVTDFGLARPAGRDETGGGQEETGDTPSPRALGLNLTETGAILGTPAYMAPEQHRGRPADARSDQFAFCVALYEGLYGERPFTPAVSETAPTVDASSPEAKAQDVSPSAALALAVVEGRVRDAPRGIDVPTWLRRAVLRGLDRDPERRWSSMHELLGALVRDSGTRRRQAIAVASVLAALIGVAAWGIVRRSGGGAEVCGGAKARLTTVWGAEARERVRQAFLASEAPQAEAIFARVAGGLDAYADGWTRMHGEACRATRVTGEQSERVLDLRMSCLERRRTDLAALVSLFAQTDAEIVPRSIDAVALLPRVSDCARADALTARVPPPDAVTAAAVEALEVRIAEVNALGLAGKHKGALDKAKAAAGDARALGYAPLTAQAVMTLGRITKLNGDFAAAEILDLEAVALAAAGRDDDVLVDTLVELTMIEARYLSNYQGARMLALAADAQAQRAGVDDLRRARVHIAKGDVQYYQGHYDEARAEYEEALAVSELIYGRNSPNLVSLINDIGDTVRRQGRPADAIPMYERVLAMIEENYGPEHPQVANALSSLGNVAMEQGRYDASRDYQKRALALKEKLLGPDHVNVANSVNTLAYLEFMTGRLDEADVLYQRALEIRTKKFGLESIITAASLEGLGHVRLGQRRLLEALEIYQRVLQIKEAKGAEPRQLAITLRNVASALSKLERYAEAVAAGERGVALVEKSLGEDHRETADTLTSLAEVHVAGERCDRAEPILRRALTTQEKPENTDDPHVITTLALLGSCEIRGGRAAEGLGHARRSIAAAEQAGMAPDMLGEIRMVVARGLWATGGRRGAVDAAEQAKAELSKAGPGGTEQLAEAKRWLAGHRP